MRFDALDSLVNSRDQIGHLVTLEPGILIGKCRGVYERVIFKLTGQKLPVFDIQFALDFGAEAIERDAAVIELWIGISNIVEMQPVDLVIPGDIHPDIEDIILDLGMRR